MPAIAYSYLRFSSGAQAEGDSIRRQGMLAQAWCNRHGATLDTSTTYEDRGRSAYHGKHREKGVLALFLAEVETGRIPRGSYLIIENLDRLSRENPWDAVPLLCALVNAGISVVTLSPSEQIYQRSRDLTPLVLAVVEFGRGHSESASKADRMTAVWEEKKRQAREGEDLITAKLPAWLTVVGRRRVGNHVAGGKVQMVPERVAEVQRMFNLSSQGMGLSLIVRDLTRRGVKPWGRGQGWSKRYVHKVLTGRAVLGEHQPLKGGKPDGKPIPGYYPAIIEQEQWDAVQAMLKKNASKPGRLGNKVANLFASLWDARTGGKMHIAWQTSGSGKKKTRIRALVPADAMEGRAKYISFPAEVFESAILQELAEVDPADVLGEEPASASAGLAAELASVEARLSAVEAEMTEADEDIPALVRTVKALDARRRDLVQRLAEARQQEANPRAASWAEARTLLDVARDEATRLRLRCLLSQVIERIDVLVVPRRSHRFCVVQIRFVGGGQREYLIHHRAAGYCRAGGWEVRSFADALPGAEDFDLRDPVHVADLEQALGSGGIGCQ